MVRFLIGVLFIGVIWAGGTQQTILPKESDELFANPGMGWQTNDVNYISTVQSGFSYRFYSWRDLEPQPGQYYFKRALQTLDSARIRGQTLMFRIATTSNSPDWTPKWLEQVGCKVRRFSRDGRDSLPAPDFDDPVCWDYFSKMVSALAQQISNNPDVVVDVGTVGLWGEWHFSGANPPVPLPSLQTKKKIIDLFIEKFPNSPKVVLINDVDGLTYGVSQGTGFRGDCLGDRGFASSTWNHMANMYPVHIDKAKAEFAWMTAPVGWESCYTMQGWIEKGYNVHDIFQYALDYHSSFFHHKGAPIPPGYEKEVEWFLKKLGYRLVLRKFEFSSQVQAGDSLTVSMKWENVGVAPPYKPYAPMLRFRSLNVDGKNEEQVVPLHANVTEWLPSLPILHSETIKLPASLRSGKWEIAIGIAGTPGIPMLRLAIEGRDASGWYPMGNIVIK